MRLFSAHAHRDWLTKWSYYIEPNAWSIWIKIAGKKLTKCSLFHIANTCIKWIVVNRAMVIANYRRIYDTYEHTIHSIYSILSLFFLSTCIFSYKWSVWIVMSIDQQRMTKKDHFDTYMHIYEYGFCMPLCTI